LANRTPGRAPAQVGGGRVTGGNVAGRVGAMSVGEGAMPFEYMFLPLAETSFSMLKRKR